MGFGGYSHDAHVALTAARSTAKVSEVFSQRGHCHEQMRPFGGKLRESRDSKDHPKSVGVIFALDVSGSMGEIPGRLATKTLPSFMKAMLDAGVADPQVLFMGIGNAIGDMAPLQIGQFESNDKLMDQWLTRIFLEAGGGGGDECYELAMYFAARHTAMDCLQKRKRRGYLFITGDENPNPFVYKDQVKRLIGDPLEADIPIRSIIEETKKSFELFYLIPDGLRGQQVGAPWRKLLGERVIVMDKPDDTSVVAAELLGPYLDGAGALPTEDAFELRERVGQAAREAFGPPRFVELATPAWRS